MSTSYLTRSTWRNKLLAQFFYVRLVKRTSGPHLPSSYLIWSPKTEHRRIFAVLSPPLMDFLPKKPPLPDQVNSKNSCAPQHVELLCIAGADATNSQETSTHLRSFQVTLHTAFIRDLASSAGTLAPVHQPWLCR